MKKNPYMQIFLQLFLNKNTTYMDTVLPILYITNN